MEARARPQYPFGHRRGSHGRLRAEPSTPGRGRRLGLLQPERSAAPLRPRQSVAREDHDPLAVRHRTGADRPRRRSAPRRHGARPLKRVLTDPKYLIVLLITLVLALGEARYHILGGYDRLATTLGVCMIAEALLSWWLRGRVANLASAYITGISLALLTKPAANILWPFALGAFLAIASTYVLTYSGCHLSNTHNFAIALLVLAAPASVAILRHQWGNDMRINLVIWFFGLLVASRARVLRVTLTYVACFIVLATLTYVACFI